LDRLTVLSKLEGLRYPHIPRLVKFSLRETVKPVFRQFR
jgi:hypothetical protein